MYYREPGELETGIISSLKMVLEVLLSSLGGSKTEAYACVKGTVD